MQSTCDGFGRADLAEQARDYARALREHSSAAAACSSDVRARFSELRAEYLRQHAEGNFAPFAQLERARAGEPGASAALQNAVDAFPSGQVAAEARLMLAQMHLRTAPEAPQAFAQLRALLADPAASGDLREQGARLWFTYASDAGGVARAWDVHTGLRGVAGYRQRTQRLLLRELLASLSMLMVALYIFACGRALFLDMRTERARAQPLRVRFGRGLAVPVLCYALLSGAILPALMSALGTELNPRPFAALAFATCSLIGIGSARASTRPRPGNLSAPCAAAVGAAAYLALRYIEPAYLQSFGL